MFVDYPKYEYLLAQLQLVLFMLAMGATLTVNDFTVVFRRPRDLVYGLTMQLLLMPLLAVVFNRLFNLSGGIAIGLVLVGALPGGSLKNVLTYLARGNVALSIALSALGTLLSLVTLPLVLLLLVQEYVPPEFCMPIVEIVRDTALCLLLPLVVGMLVVRFLPRYQRALSRVSLYSGFFFVAVMIIGSLGSGRIHPREYPWHVPLAIIAFCIAAQQLNMLPYRLMRWPSTSCVALGLEVTCRNINLALLLKALLFPAEKGVDPLGDGVLFVVLYYGAVAFIVGLPLTLRMRRVIRKQQQRMLPSWAETAIVCRGADWQNEEKDWIKPHD
jgi:BASS family bile acid:Na+ symporter